ncbi:MAG TPA: hypothetical protein PL155_04970 [Candidatus Omnitrophota bacterium]|nr:hypothetical protein [Candidatus Omnitrophota bacterium]HPD84169.1 hypothetical protein [Candidatus Omnitrophota bacterium]HRZ03026.1 hypothetical protein [Candidatus Omnitrophota bacterium]
MKEWLDYLSSKSHAAIILWFILVIIVIKIYEIFLAEKVNAVVTFSGDANKQVMFGVLLSAVFMLGLTIAVYVYYKAIFMWFVLSIGVAIGGLLGILPARNKKRGKRGL